MNSPQKPPQPPAASNTLLGRVTQVVQRVGGKVNFSKLKINPKARVAKLRVQDADAASVEEYPLLGDRYLLGRSSKSCDIVVRNPVVSQVHLSLTRDSRQGKTAFVMKDEGSTNGIYRGRRRLTKLPLRDGDSFTLGPPELASVVKIEFQDPPPWYVKTARYGLYGFTGLTAIAAVWVGIQWQRFSVIPLPQSVQGPVVVYARDGVTPLNPVQNRTHVEAKSLSEFSRYLPDAVIASEDSRYYWHLGVDPLGIARALFTNLRGGEIREGGSTLTQQLARNLFRDFVGTQDSAGRKLREAVVALKLETFYSKDDLMLTYLNRVYLGSGNYGFEDAARFYFGKSAKDLTLSEAATLVGILPAPNTFNPVRDYETAVQFRDRVINRMVAQGKVSVEEGERARRSRIDLNPEAVKQLQSAIAPYYYAQVFSELEKLLGSQLAQEGNFIVESNLNPEMQRQAEASLKAAIETEGVAAGFSQGALVTMDASNGAVLALVGGVDYQQSQFNRASQALRQPGSTFKVFAYAAALEQGISPTTQFSCSPLNWQGQSFRGCERSGAGSLDMYDGLALSENAVALRIGQEAGLDRVIQTAQKMGITDPLSPNPGLVLGQSEVNLLELTGAYAVFANRGVRNPPHTIRRILDSSDCTDPDNFQTCRVIYDSAQDRQANQAVLSPDIADTMTTLMRGVVQGGTGRAAAIGLGEVGKTGTNNDNRDLWFVGYLPSRTLVTGVWFGNDDNSPTSGSSSQAAQLWGEYMGRVVQ